MKKNITILIADRNQHVRELLRREMMEEGYGVRLAKSVAEVFKKVYQPEPLDLLILDPDLPDAYELSVLENLEDRIPSLPVVVHTLLPGYSRQLHLLKGAVLVEKSGSSIERLKQVVSDMLQKSDADPAHALSENSPHSRNP